MKPPLSYLTVLLLIIISPTVYAQDFKGEILAGMTTSQISGDQLCGFYKAGVMGGLGVQYKVSNITNIGFRLLYTQKGSRQPSNLANGDPTYYLLRLNYIEAPLFVHLTFKKKWSFEAGMSMAFLLHQYEEDQDGELQYRKPFNSTDLSVMGGFGYEITPEWTIQSAIWQSILPVRKHAGDVTYRLNNGQLNTVISCNLLYTFQHKK